MTELVLSNCLEHILGELQYATDKYPNFADRFLVPSETSQHIKSQLTAARQTSDAEKATGYSIQATLNEEVFEVYEAYAEHAYISCYQELAQVAQVAIRAMAWVWEHHLKGADNGNNG